MKVCTGCGTEKPLTEFGVEKGKPNGRKARCKPCARKWNKASYDKNPASRVAATLRWKAKKPAHVKAYMAERRLRIKAELVAGYGGKCTCCGETSIEFLTLEHLNGGGRAHRAIKDSLAIFNEVIKSNFPSEYTILCMNCNFAKRFGKECPHITTGTNAAKIDTLVKALEECRTSYCGYAITKSEQYPDVLANFWKEIKRIDGIARAALDTIKEPA